MAESYRLTMVNSQIPFWLSPLSFQCLGNNSTKAIEQKTILDSMRGNRCAKIVANSLILFGQTELTLIAKKFAW